MEYVGWKTDCLQITISVISGSSGDTFLSPNFVSFDFGGGVSEKGWYANDIPRSSIVSSFSNKLARVGSESGMRIYSRQQGWNALETATPYSHDLS